MTYYEQFGLAPGASPEEIHRTYRHLCRLLHPDHQQQQELRAAAEAQMRWVNQVFETLRDPERRRAYDATLSAVRPEAAGRFSFPTEWVGWRTGLWYVCAIAAVAAIAWHTSGARAGMPSPPKTAQAAARPGKEPPPARGGSPQAMRRAARTVAPQPPAGSARPAAPSGLASRAGIPPQPRLESPFGSVLAPPPGSLTKWTIPPPNLAAESTAAWETPAPFAPPALIVPHRFAGTWYYVPESRTEPDGSRSVSFYAPEFIQIVITELGDALQGRYRARYRVADRAISPNVVFHFRGQASQNTAQLQWSGEGGAAGDARLRFLSGDSLEMTWSTTVFGEAPQLAAGRAVLVRRAGP